MVLKRILATAKRLISGRKQTDSKSPSSKPASGAHEPKHKPHAAKAAHAPKDVEGHKAHAPRADQPAEGSRPRGPRRHEGPRPEGAPPADGAAPARERRAPSGDRPPRAQGDRPQRPQGERSHGDRPRRDRGPRRGPPPEPTDGTAVSYEASSDSDSAAPRRHGPKAKPEAVPLEADSPFRKLGLSEDVLNGIKHAGYTTPTPIQEQAIPVLLSGKDLTGSAQTGTGKTAAFVLPILSRLGTPGKLRCLILEPTRELADQVRQNLDTLSVFTDLRHTAIFGGVKHGPQRDAINRGLDILVATPGRLLDHVEAGDLSLKDVEILVLDEVDRMLDIGFLPQVRKVVKLCPAARQTMLFSATIPEQIAALASWALKDPVRIEIGIKRSVADTITHGLYPVDSQQKFDLLLKLLDKTEFKSVIVFCRTRMGTDRIWEWLKAQGHNVGVMHSDRTQGQRMEALAGFKEGRYEVLVATDLAARGLDIATVTHVINYDVPEHPEDYVHRIGRTGRAMKDGDAFTIYTPNDMAHVDAIERFLGRTIDRIRVEGFTYDPDPIYLFQQKQPVVAQARNFKFRGRR